MHTDTYVGIDVSKLTLDVFISSPQTHLVVPNDPAGIAQLVGQMRDLAPSRIVLEATGGSSSRRHARLPMPGLPIWNAALPNPAIAPWRWSWNYSAS